MAVMEEDVEQESSSSRGPELDWIHPSRQVAVVCCCRDGTSRTEVSLGIGRRPWAYMWARVLGCARRRSTRLLPAVPICLGSTLRQVPR